MSGIMRTCRHPGCRALVADGARYCARHAPAADQAKRERGRRFDQRRGGAPWRKWYKLAAWRKLRAWRLRLDPLCRLCLANGVETPATIVDHRAPHRGQWALFFAAENTQSLCKRCHDSTKQREERSAERMGGGPKIPGAAQPRTGGGRQNFSRGGITGGVS